MRSWAVFLGTVMKSVHRNTDALNKLSDIQEEFTIFKSQIWNEVRVWKVENETIKEQQNLQQQQTSQIPVLRPPTAPAAATRGPPASSCMVPTFQPQYGYNPQNNIPLCGYLPNKIPVLQPRIPPAAAIQVSPAPLYMMPTFQPQFGYNPQNSIPLCGYPPNEVYALSQKPLNAVEKIQMPITNASKLQQFSSPLVPTSKFQALSQASVVIPTQQATNIFETPKSSRPETATETPPGAPGPPHLMTTTNALFETPSLTSLVTTPKTLFVTPSSNQAVTTTKTFFRIPSSTQTVTSTNPSFDISSSTQTVTSINVVLAKPILTSPLTTTKTLFGMSSSTQTVTNMNTLFRASSAPLENTTKTFFSFPEKVTGTNPLFEKSSTPPVTTTKILFGIPSFTQTVTSTKTFETPSSTISTIPRRDLVEIKTGEEGEEKVFGERSKLFRYDFETGQWKERGVGEMEILKQEDKERYRLLMRRESILKVCANHVIDKDITLTPMLNSGRAWCWTAIDFSEGEGTVETFALEFTKSEIATKFKEVFESCQEKTEAVSSPEKNPSVKPLKPPTSTPSGGALSFLFETKDGSWECSGCFTKNDGNFLKCPCCAKCKPDVKAGDIKQDKSIIWVAAPSSSTMPSTTFSILKFLDRTEKTESNDSLAGLTNTGTETGEAEFEMPFSDLNSNIFSPASTSVPKNELSFRPQSSGNGSNIFYSNPSDGESKRSKALDSNKEIPSPEGTTPIFKTPKQLQTSQETVIPISSKLSPKPPPLSSFFKSKTGTWECSGCLYRNEGHVAKCSACNNHKPGANNEKSTQPSLSTPASTFTFGQPGFSKTDTFLSRTPTMPSSQTQTTIMKSDSTKVSVDSTEVTARHLIPESTGMEQKAVDDADNDEVDDGNDDDNADDDDDDDEENEWGGDHHHDEDCISSEEDD